MSRIENLDRRINHGEIMIGLIDDLSEEYYRHYDAVSQSTLKEYKKSGAHGRASQIKDKEFKKHFNLGDAFHRATLTPKRFEETTAVIPDEMPDSKGVIKPTDKKMNSYKEWAEKNHDKLILSSDERNTVVDMMASVHSHPIAGKILGSGRPEVSAFTEMNAPWFNGRTQKMEIARVRVKARFDWLHTINSIPPLILDLKSCEDARPEKFSKSILDWGYHIQAAFYLDIAWLCGYEAESFKILAIEKEPPYACRLYTISEKAIERGREEYQMLLGTYAACEKHQQWDSYPEDDFTIDLPEFYYRRSQ